jgi:hypothetical protein
VALPDAVHAVPAKEHAFSVVFIDYELCPGAVVRYMGKVFAGQAQ